MGFTACQPTWIILWQKQSYDKNDKLQDVNVFHKLQF